MSPGKPHQALHLARAGDLIEDRLHPNVPSLPQAHIRRGGIQG